MIEAAVAAGATVSVDTRRAETMRAAIDHGAAIVNDVTALDGDPDSLDAVAETGAEVNPYAHAGEARNHAGCPQISSRFFRCLSLVESTGRGVRDSGHSAEQDSRRPGYRFRKTDVHNIEFWIVPGFYGLGCAVAIGVSRKSFIGRIAGIEKPQDRQAGTLVATVIALSRGCRYTESTMSLRPGRL